MIWDEQCGIVAMAVRTISVISNSGHISISFYQMIIAVPRAQPLEIPSVHLKACEIPPKLGSKYSVFFDLASQETKEKPKRHSTGPNKHRDSIFKKK